MALSMKNSKFAFCNACSHVFHGMLHPLKPPGITAREQADSRDTKRSPRMQRMLITHAVPSGL